MDEIRIVGPGKTRGYPYPVCKKKVFHGVVAVGTVEAVASPYLKSSKWKVEPIPLLSLVYAFLIRNRYPFIVGLTEGFPVVG